MCRHINRIIEKEVGDNITVSVMKESDVDACVRAILNNFDWLSPRINWVNGEATYESLTEKFETNLQKISKNNWTEVRSVPFVVKKCNSPVGMVYAAINTNHKNAYNLGFWISENEAGNGYISNAVLGVVSILYDDFAAKKIEIQCVKDNPATQSVARKNGFEFQEIKTQEFCINSKVFDVHCYVKQM